MKNKIRELWREHQAAAYPEGIAGDEVEGQCLVSLDTFTAGCISTFVGNSGTTDPERTESLIRCRDGLAKVVPKLAGEARVYYERLQRMSELALHSLGK